ncbi:MAG: hypothetical protein ACREEM_20095 [Blastocatellia bacterium]
MLRYEILFGFITAAMVAGNTLIAQQEKKVVVSESPIACSLTALSTAQRKRHGDLTGRLRAAVAELRELPDGYAFRLPADETRIRETAEWMAMERLCCPFLAFNLEVGREGGPLWLHLTGREGIKAFLLTELKLK